MPRIVPNLWFDTEAIDAAAYYVAIFPSSRITNITHYPEGGMRPAGTVLTVDFELDGRPFTAINGGPQFSFDEAVSFLVECADQDEIDRYWSLLGRGGSEGPCGWLKDRYGLSWQIVPKEWATYLEDPERAAKAFGAIMTMTKIDIAAVRLAVDGG